MDRYISANEAMHELAKVFKPDDFPKIVRGISSTSTAYVREDIHAYWKEEWNTFFHKYLPRCSSCRNYTPLRYKFCPNCGAQMNERSEDG